MKFSEIIKFFLIWQMIVVGVSLVAVKSLPIRESYIGGGAKLFRTSPLLLSRANFDGNNYISISANGYGNSQQAFFPLYPSLIRYVRTWFNPSDEQRVQVSAAIGVAISVISFVGALWFLDKLIRLDYSVNISRLAIIALIVFPTSFFFTAVYTEGIFFLFLISSFYFARTRKWWWAGALAGLASYTKFMGIFLFPALLIEMWQQKKIQDFLPLLLAPAGLMAYMYFLQKTTGDPLAFLHVLPTFGTFRSDHIVLLYQVFCRYTKMLVTVHPRELIYVNIVFEAFVGMVFLVTSVLAFLKQRASYAMFNLAAYLIPTLTGSFVSLPRYVLVCFPSFILLGQFLVSRPRLRVGYLLVSGSVFVLFLTLFTAGYWTG